jgi:hypothetical protein
VYGVGCGERGIEECSVVVSHSADGESGIFAETYLTGNVEFGGSSRFMTYTDEFFAYIKAVSRRGLEGEEEAIVTPFFGDGDIEGEDVLVGILLPFVIERVEIRGIVVAEFLDGVLVVVGDDVGTWFDTVLLNLYGLLGISQTAREGEQQEEEFLHRPC